MKEAVEQHLGKVVEDSRFLHTMALSLNPKSNYHDGLIRCITRREGDVQVVGYTDYSDLYYVHGESLEQAEVGEKLHIQGQEEIIQSLHHEGMDYLGLEDPDIYIDTNTDVLHVYFTIPIQNVADGNYQIHLGHAEGQTLKTLQMTRPVLSPTPEVPWGAKELSVAPRNGEGTHLHLVESSEMYEGAYHSVIRNVRAEQPNGDWSFGEIVFHPREDGYTWCNGHGSPGPLLPSSFLDVGEGKLLGILNGREKETQQGKKIIFGMFSVGLFIYDYEDGQIEWVSEEPLIQDTEAKTITFASQFIETASGEGILYAHVDDSFVRAYTLHAEGIKQLLP